MALHIACSHFNSDCPASFTTVDEDELIKHVEIHTGEVHSHMDWTPELVEVVKTKIERD